MIGQIEEDSWSAVLIVFLVDFVALLDRRLLYSLT